MAEPIRILVVDDSDAVRALLIRLLRAEPDLEVVGQAASGEEAVRLVARLRPDVVTIDYHMPGLGGLGAIRQIMRTIPTPITVISDLTETDSAQALAAGALSVVAKPADPTPHAYEPLRAQLAAAVRLVAGVQLVTLSRGLPPYFDTRADQRPVRLVAIAASTGGPGALHRILAPLPASFSIPLVIVQHITTGFGDGFAAWLNSIAAVEVRLARHGDLPQPGRVLIAPEGQHLFFDPGGVIRLDDTPPINDVRPSADLMFGSIAHVYRSTALGIVLTGMGSDGVVGLEQLWQSGGYTIAQDESSCVVFGMPRAAIERGVIHQVLTPEEISALLLRLHQQRQPSPSSTALPRGYV